MWKWEAETDDFGMWSEMKVDGRKQEGKKEELKENVKWNCLIINEIWSAEGKNVSRRLISSFPSRFIVSIRSLCRHDMWLKREEEAARKEKNCLENMQT